MFTVEEEAALRAYSGDEFKAINAHLRGEEDGYGRVLGLIAALDSAFQKATAPPRQFLYRGVSGDVADIYRLSGVRSGSALTDPAFLSTSDQHLGARTFAAWPPGLVIQLKVGPLTRAIDLAPFSGFPEREFLLPRRTRILVKSIDYDKRWMEAEIS